MLSYENATKSNHLRKSGEKFSLSNVLSWYRFIYLVSINEVLNPDNFSWAEDVPSVRS